MCIRDSAYAGVGVAMQNAEQPVKDCADYEIGRAHV